MMNTDLAVIVSIFALAVVMMIYKENKENFEAVGLVYNVPSEWFNKKAYDAKDWLVTYYPEQISNPICMYKSRGNSELLNYYSSAYRFWRM